MGHPRQSTKQEQIWARLWHGCGYCVHVKNNGRKPLVMRLYCTDNKPKGDQNMKNEKATLIGIVAGVKYYENPVLGDEAPLMVKVNGELIETDYWELSDADDNA